VLFGGFSKHLNKELQDGPVGHAPSYSDGGPYMCIRPESKTKAMGETTIKTAKRGLENADCNLAVWAVGTTGFEAPGKAAAARQS